MRGRGDGFFYKSKKINTTGGTKNVKILKKIVLEYCFLKNYTGCEYFYTQISSKKCNDLGYKNFEILFEK